MLREEFQRKHHLTGQMEVHLAGAPLDQLLILEQLFGQAENLGEPLGAGARCLEGTLGAVMAGGEVFPPSARPRSQLLESVGVALLGWGGKGGW